MFNKDITINKSTTRTMTLSNHASHSDSEVKLKEKKKEILMEDE